jgi:transcriptional regulator with XRE-family HTH domain
MRGTMGKKPKAKKPKGSGRTSSPEGDKLAKVLGGRIREERHKLGLTQKQLAARAEVTEVYIYLVEKGAENPTIGVLARLAAGVGVEPGELLQDANGGSSKAGRVRGAAEQLSEMIKKHAEMESKLLESIFGDASSALYGARKSEGRD